MVAAEPRAATIKFGRELLRDALRIIAAEYGGPVEYARAAVEDWPGNVAVAYVGPLPVAAAVFYKIRLAKPLCVHYYLAVDSRHRGKGLGKLLTSSVERHCAAPAYAATTEEDNAAALALFRSMGYSAYRWEALDGRTRSVLLKATCGYDDDVILIKGADPRELAASEGEADEFNSRKCYGVWLRLRNL